MPYVLASINFCQGLSNKFTTCRITGIRVSKRMACPSSPSIWISMRRPPLTPWSQCVQVIRSRQNSAGGERPKVSSAGPEEAKRRSSASNASVRSAATPPARQAPAESLANMSVQPPSPSKIKSGPWLSGTYRLPKSVSEDVWRCVVYLGNTGRLEKWGYWVM